MTPLTEEQKRAKILYSRKRYYEDIEKTREYERKRKALYRERKRREQREQEQQNKIIDNIGKSYISVN